MVSNQRFISTDVSLLSSVFFCLTKSFVYNKKMSLIPFHTVGRYATHGAHLISSSDWSTSARQWWVNNFFVTHVNNNKYGIHIYINKQTDLAVIIMTVDHFWFVVDNSKWNWLFKGYAHKCIRWILRLNFTKKPFQQLNSVHPSIFLES